jgi:hypothetical protein
VRLVSRELEGYKPKQNYRKSRMPPGMKSKVPLYGAKFLANFLAYAERSNSNGAAPGNKNPVRKYPRTLT